MAGNYHQLQCIPTPFLWQSPRKAKLEDLVFPMFSMDSLVLLLPIMDAVTEDFPPTVTFALQACAINAPTPINRSVTEDFPPTVTYSLQSVLQLTPVNDTVTEDFPPTVTYSLQSSLIVMPVNRTVTDDFPPNATFALQSVVA